MKRSGGKPSASPGRPVDRDKQAAILAAARDLFFERGLEAVAIEAIATASGVSKVTIYKHFGDKASIFSAVVRQETNVMERELASLQAAGATLRQTLTGFGMRLMEFLSRPELVAFDQALAQEAHRHPDLAQRFFHAGPGRVRTVLALVIDAAAARGELAPDDPERAAEDLIGLWQGFMPLEGRFGITAPPASDEIRQRVTRGVDLFLRAHAPG